MRALIQTKATMAWLVLSALTLIAWAVSTHRDVSSESSVAVIVIAVFKIRLIGLYFMELREAPRGLRSLFEGYCTFLLCTFTGMFLWM